MRRVVIGRYHQAWVENLNWRKVKLSDGHDDDSLSTDEGIAICYCFHNKENQLIFFFFDWHLIEVEGADSGSSCLFIQMEYCPTTLKQILSSRTSEDFSNAQENWTWLRQILEGLEHIHG